MRQFNITRYSSIEIGSLMLPICISMDKIKDDHFYEVSEYIVDKREIRTVEGKDVLVKDDTQSLTHFFYGKFKDVLRISKIIEIIYGFVDIESLEIIGLDSFIFSEKEFRDICLNTSGVSQKDILDNFYIILSIIKEMKDEFRKQLIEATELLQEFPKIPKNPDDDKYAVPKQYIEYLNYPSAMVHLKACIEYSGEVYFKENLGRAFDDYSWREKELRKIYDTSKSKIDGFTEAVKGFVQKNAMKT